MNSSAGTLVVGEARLEEILRRVLSEYASITSADIIDDVIFLILCDIKSDSIISEKEQTSISKADEPFSAAGVCAEGEIELL